MLLGRNENAKRGYPLHWPFFPKLLGIASYSNDAWSLGTESDE